jgi:superfamily II DNA helicase RecQ
MWAAPHKTFSQTQTTLQTATTVQEKQSPPAFYIVIATNAFGMGIDNPHVRFVVHWTPPRSFEGFVQESGRAGRDGRAALSIVYYNPQERERVIDRIRRDQDGTFDTTTAGITLVGRKRKIANSEESTNAKTRNREAVLASFEKVVKYCETTNRCRHEVIKEFSGDLELETEERERRHQQQRDTAGQNANTVEPSSTAESSLCDFACDFCKEGEVALTRRKELMAPESLPDEYYDLPGGTVPQAVAMMFEMNFTRASAMHR